MSSKDYVFNIYVNDDYRFSVIAFGQFIDEGYYTVDTTKVLDRLDFYLDDNLTVEQAEVVTHAIGHGRWLEDNGIDDYVGGIDEWYNFDELAIDAPSLLKQYLDSLPEYELEVA
jgi:hypothetical protein